MRARNTNQAKTNVAPPCLWMMEDEYWSIKHSLVNTYNPQPIKIIATCSHLIGLIAVEYFSFFCSTGGLCSESCSLFFLLLNSLIIHGTRIHAPIPAPHTINPPSWIPSLLKASYTPITTITPKNRASHKNTRCGLPARMRLTASQTNTAQMTRQNRVGKRKVSMAERIGYQKYPGKLVVRWTIEAQREKLIEKAAGKLHFFCSLGEYFF